MAKSLGNKSPHWIFVNETVVGHTVGGRYTDKAGQGDSNDGRAGPIYCHCCVQTSRYMLGKSYDERNERSRRIYAVVKLLEYRIQEYSASTQVL
jgi:hypothetical protein